ncbi:hypothetical protein FAIPA1_230083 [Frankia sp. AiPs1]
MHHGDITVESEPGNTRFQVYLALAVPSWRRNSRKDVRNRESRCGGRSTCVATSPR